MSLSPLTALSAVDGRYRHVTEPLAAHFSESALIEWRLRVEMAWLEKILPHLAPTLNTKKKVLETIKKEIAGKKTLRNDKGEEERAWVKVKRIETATKHDVKAVEYWLMGRLQEHDADALCPYVHFACTSWDINNIAFSLQVMGALREVMLPPLRALKEKLCIYAHEHADTPMLSRTHGQAASPTTVGKEFANVAVRLAAMVERLEAFQLPAKFNGAVGNYNAHVIAAPTVDWRTLTREFVESFASQGLRFSPYTTQIEPYDELAALFDLLRRVNMVLLDFCRDCWSYISADYFSQKKSDNIFETGSSTMPHKINPIDFENAEGNLGVANALFSHFGDKLPVSRLQRDLSDSTVLRAVGGAFGHTLIAWRAAVAGLDKISINKDKLAADLNANWQVLTEAVQTALRAAGDDLAYEKLKDLSRGKPVTAATLHKFIDSLELKQDVKARLLALTPATYCGLAGELARAAIAEAGNRPCRRAKAKK